MLTGVFQEKLRQDKGALVELTTAGATLAGVATLAWIGSGPVAMLAVTSLGFVLGFAASTVLARGLIRFRPFGDSVYADNGPQEIVSLDSFTLEIEVLRAVDGVDDLEFVVHRLPVSVDETTTYNDLIPFFEDSTTIATIPVPDKAALDTLARLSAVFPPGAFPAFGEDSLIAAVGLALRTASGGFVDLTTRERSEGRALLTRHVTAVELGDTVSLADSQEPAFDSFVAPDAPAPGAAALAVGGIPSSRAILRVNLPPAIADSSDIVRATLILVPEGPALGGPGDSVMLHTFGLQADIGLKSPYWLPTVSDTVIPGLVRVPVGSADIIRVDITHILRPWQSDSTLPHAMFLMVLPEATALSELRVLSSRSTMAPGIHITYLPLFLVEDL